MHPFSSAHSSPRSHPRRWERPVPTTPPAPVRTADDALRLVSLAVALPLRPETICFPLNAEGVGGVATIVSGTARPEALFTVVEFMCRVMAGSARTSLVLATVRPGSGLLVGDVDRWCEASELCAAQGLLLREWYVIGPGGIDIPRELLGEPERWAH